jgi:hypothetical protein
VGVTDADAVEVGLGDAEHRGSSGTGGWSHSPYSSHTSSVHGSPSSVH